MTMQMSWGGVLRYQESKLACCILYTIYFLLKVVKGVRKIS